MSEWCSGLDEPKLNERKSLRFLSVPIQPFRLDTNPSEPRCRFTGRSTLFSRSTPMGQDESPQPESTGSTAVKLLRAASELVGGEERLAQRLNMSLILLRKFMAGRDELPPHILLRTVDLLQEERESALASSGHRDPTAFGGGHASDSHT
jgi:hypothetical protein